MRGSVCDIFCLISGTTARCPIAAIIAIIRPSSDTSLALRSAVIACACRFCSVSQSLEGGFGVGSTQGASSDPMGNEAGAGANRRRSPPISATPFFGGMHMVRRWCGVRVNSPNHCLAATSAARLAASRASIFCLASAAFSAAALNRSS
jgi:hypothetical protein